jgi:hypothetical protein
MMRSPRAAAALSHNLTALRCDHTRSLNRKIDENRSLQRIEDTGTACGQNRRKFGKLVGASLTRNSGARQRYVELV